MKELLEQIRLLQASGLEVAIEMPRGGNWIEKDARLSVDHLGWLIWEQGDLMFYFPPNAPIFLRGGRR